MLILVLVLFILILVVHLAVILIVKGTPFPPTIRPIGVLRLFVPYIFEGSLVLCPFALLGHRNHVVGFLDVVVQHLP